MAKVRKFIGGEWCYDEMSDETIKLLGFKDGKVDGIWEIVDDNEDGSVSSKETNQSVKSPKATKSAKDKNAETLVVLDNE